MTAAPESTWRQATMDSHPRTPATGPAMPAHPNAVHADAGRLDGHRPVTGRADTGRPDTGRAWLRGAMAALAVLAAGAAVVSWNAQYVMVVRARHTVVIAALEAGIPDVGAAVFAALGIALALHGRRALRPRILNLACVGLSLAMNAMAAGPSWRAAAIWVMPAAVYALASDSLITVVRAHAISRMRATGEILAGALKERKFVDGRLIDEPDNNLGEIGKLINQDVALSAAIFKLLGSPLYPQRTRATSTATAISLIGVHQAANLVQGLALRNAIVGQEMAYEKFWERSHEIATLSAIIAGKQISACNIPAEQAYMAGLFHECGIPILMQRFPDYCGEFRLNEGLNWPDHREEDLRYHTDHAVVGYLVAKHWKLPGFICEAARFHHDMLHVEHAALTMVSILQAACHLQARIHHQRDDGWHAIREQVLEEIGVEEKESTEFLEDVTDTFIQHGG